MKTIETVSALRKILDAERERRSIVGFVPTMGALHQGHLSLVEASKEKADLSVVSIFVNPTQFSPGEDFNRYPRTIESDAKMLAEAGVDILFLPGADEIYPEGNATRIEVVGIGDRFEGAIRPGHFSGVATVVAILFDIVKPSVAFFGQKDAQQLAIIRRMVKDLHFPIAIEVGQTVRSESGLALSSRNRYLSPYELREAESIPRVLNLVASQIRQGASFEKAISDGRAEFSQITTILTLDYLEIVDSETFQIASSFKLSESCTIIIAARISRTRLIDNLVILKEEVES